MTSFTLGVMLGALFPIAWFMSGFELVPLSSEARSEGEQTEESESARISVIDQPSGDVVDVDSVDVAESVWVAVREMNGTEFGNVLGAVRIGGARLGITIPLLRATEPRERYAIELYRDDGTGTFSPGAYSVYVDFDTGKRVVAYFNTTE